MNKFRVPFFLASFCLVVLASIGLILFARGYKLDLQKKTLRSTGLLVATSVPNGAQVFVDGKLASATDATLSLSPGTYQVEIKKDGFSPWKKTLKIEKELVTKTDAYLFPAVPDLRPMTTSGAQEPLVSPDGTRIAYALPFSAADYLTMKAGVWVADLTESPLGILSRAPRQIAKSSHGGRDFAQTKLEWSPDSRQLLVTFGPGKASEENFLLDPGQLNASTSLIDVTPSLGITKKEWQKEKETEEKIKLEKLPPEMLKIIPSAATDLAWSADNTKLLYTATASATIADNLISPVPAASSQTQERDIKTNRIYVYDIKEDRNFFIMESPNPPPLNTKFSTLNTRLSWFPTSKNLLFVEPEKITILEYDGTNRQVVYSGPFENTFVFPAPSANKLIILTSFGQPKGSLPNLYSLNLR
ncbi:PEGA domain-containing protein [Candidatus Shapirobacteria bacterium]|nr:PEGA domain-containing protein [Candidatus Shapirobacteria bacterium]